MKKKMGIKRPPHNPRTPTPEFAEHVLEVFQSFGKIELRRMFSGYGLFRDGVMFGLVYDQAVYLKADADNLAEFLKKGLGQFQYERGGKVRGLSYYRPPDSVMDDPGEAARWAHLALKRRCAEPLQKRRQFATPVKRGGGSDSLTWIGELKHGSH